MPWCEADAGGGQQVHERIGRGRHRAMHGIQHLFVLVRTGDGQHLGMRAGDVFRVGPQTPRHDHPPVLRQRLADRIEALGLRAVEKAAGVHDHRIRAAVIGRDRVTFGAQSRQDAFAVDQRLGTAERDHADGRLAWAACLSQRGFRRDVGAKVGRVGAHAPAYTDGRRPGQADRCVGGGVRLAPAALLEKLRPAGRRPSR